MDIAEFLLARIAEDEAVAQSAVVELAQLSEIWDDDDEAAWGWAEWSRPGASFASRGPIADYVIRHDPARVLAECEAKRRIVEFYGGPIGLHYSLQFLAMPYADHPDYDPEWAPPQTMRSSTMT